MLNHPLGKYALGIQLKYRLIFRQRLLRFFLGKLAKRYFYYPTIRDAP